MSSVSRKDRAVSRQQAPAVSSDVSEEQVEVKKTVMQIEMTASVARD